MSNDPILAVASRSPDNSSARADPHGALHIETYNSGSGSASAFLFRRELNTFVARPWRARQARARIISTGWFIALFQASKAGQAWQPPRTVGTNRVPVNSIYFLGWLARPRVRGGGPIIGSYARRVNTEEGWRSRRGREGARRTEELFSFCSFFSRTKERGNYGFLVHHGLIGRRCLGRINYAR